MQTDSVSKHINPKSLELSFLREEGLKHIRELAGNTWTDHNLHDPGITILEHLCFALQDLNYQTTFPVEDLIASSQSTANRDKSFFNQAEILPSSPVTIADFRKVLIDMEGIRNAIILPIRRPEPHIYVDTAQNVLNSLAPDDNVKLSDILAVEGMYQVLLELDFEDEHGDLNDNKIIEILPTGDKYTQVEVEFPRWDNLEVDWSAPRDIVNHARHLVFWENTSFDRWVDRWDDLPQPIQTLLYGPRTDGETALVERYRKRALRAQEIKNQAKRKLEEFRNICEDFVGFHSVKIEEIAINADIEIDGEANMEEVMAEIFYHTNRFLSPTVKFKDANDPELKHIPREDLYRGPLLAHGILREEDLPKRRLLLQVSDLINILADIEGIKAIKSFSADSLPEGVLLRGGNQWCIKLNPEANYTPRLTPHRSTVTFYRDDYPLNLPLKSTLIRYDEMRLTDKKWDNSTSSLPTSTPPPGKRREISEYYSIQNDFTANYGIGPEGLPSRVSSERQLQAKQLKAYLLFFEQILANYQSQLANFSQLFSVEASEQETYFSQLLETIPGIADLYDKEEVTPVLQENEATFSHRRNRFLNHLLARLGLQISDYAMLTSDPDGDKNSSEKIQAKLNLLKNYPELSGSRYRTFNYRSPDNLWNTDNVSGLKKRICALLDIHDHRRKDLAGLDDSRGNEGFHLVEHALLRPRFATDNDGNFLQRKYLKIYTNKRCNDDLWSEDPYSYLISLVLPNWIGRFSNLQFRHYFEKTVHLESPSHLGIQFYWVGKESLEAFENHYKTWLNLNAGENPDRLKLTSALNEVIDDLNEFQEKEDYDIPGVEIHEGAQPLNRFWKIHDFSAAPSEWLYGEGNTVRQINYIGTCRRTNPGEGTVALFNPSPNTDDPKVDGLNKNLESIDLKLVMDNHAFSEAGLVFLWRDPDNYWLFHYRSSSRKVMISRVENGLLSTVLENTVTDRRGREIHLNIEKHKGNLKLREKSPNMLGSEFILNLPDSFEGTYYGLYTRYSRGTIFTDLRALDPDLIDQELIPSVGIGYWELGDNFEIL